MQHSAARVAEFLNSTALTRPYVGQQSGGQSGQQQLELAKADPRTNAVMVVGTAAEMRLAERTVLAPSARHDGHWNPTDASFMHSGQISRSQRWHEMYASRSGCR